jgi:hypothetical protein
VALHALGVITAHKSNIKQKQIVSCTTAGYWILGTECLMLGAGRHGAMVPSTAGETPLSASCSLGPCRRPMRCGRCGNQ